MRDNGPVTGIERQVPAGAFLVSRTTPEGVITFANDAFVEISGFTREELIGKPHNLVRHPDMPPAAFADLWANLQAGRCWVGTVKNRCKDGGHYWVRAAVAPVVRDGRIQSFVSVRLRPSEAEVATAEAAYRRIRDGSSGHALHRGRIRSRSAGGRLAAGWQRLTTRVAWFAGPAAVLGVTGTMHAANAATGPAIGCWIAALILGAVAFAVGALGLRSRAAGLRRDLDALAAGHDVALDLDRSDELQDLVLAIASLQTHLKAATLDLGESHRSLIASFDVQIGSVLKDLSGAIGGLGETAKRQTGLSEEVSACARSLASASTEMSSSIAEISAQTANADRLATEAQQQMNVGREASQRLGQTAVEIEDVAKAIAAIAGQTNLLALNATIEAASAGEAGRGFAVVAGEVKTLARRAHEATLDISKRITAVQQDSSAVEQAMAGIAGSIQRLAQATSSIAAAIEEQTAVTHELSTSSTHVADSAREAGTAATEVDSVAVRIGAVNTSIEKAVQVFRTGG